MNRSSFSLLRWWSRLGQLLNHLFSPLIMGVTYFVFLTPVALLYRLFRKREKQPESSFVERNKIYLPADFDNPW